MQQPVIYAKSTNNSDKKEDETHVYRHPNALNRPLESFMQVSTLHQVYSSMLENPNRKLLGKRLVDKNGKLSDHYSWFSVKKVFDTAQKIGSGLLNKLLVN